VKLGHRERLRNWFPIIETTELTEGSGKAFSTRTAYTIYLRNWIVPAWGERRLSDVRTVAVEEWLHGLSLSNGSKAKTRNLMSALFNHAMRYEWTERNPINLCADRQSGNVRPKC
jgi:site-specific recombinase XerD